MASFRSYYDHETPRVGDVIACFGEIPGAFNAGIIQKIDVEKQMAYIARPHASVSGYADYNHGQLSVGFETIDLPIEHLKRNGQVFLRGKDEIDNRRRCP